MHARKSYPTTALDVSQLHHNRLDLKLGEEWTRQVVARILSEFPDLDTYTVAAGISPSGTVHIGNLRDVMISRAVAKALAVERKSVRFIFSWDNFDRFRKVPANVPASWKEHLGKPLSKVPDPSGKFASYAESWQKQFEAALVELGIDVEYRYQTVQYEQGTYDKEMLLALEQRETIARILLENMSQKALAEKEIDPREYVEKFCPLAIYSRFTGKENTQYLGHSGTLVTYLCRDTGKEDTLDMMKDHVVKLGWKVDWPMRWKHEGVVFEPGGKDHASPGGSYDVSSEIATKVFGVRPPVFIGYEFLGVRGLKGKMSGSSGTAVAPRELLDIYEPRIVSWLYDRRAPNAAFNFAFDSEVLRQYEEYDRAHPTMPAPIPFRQAVALGQLVQWDAQRLVDLHPDHDLAMVRDRLPRAENWLKKYNPEEEIQLRAIANNDYWQVLPQVARDQISSLHEFLSQHPQATITEIEARVYEIPKEMVTSETVVTKAQRAFFKHVYQLLIGRDAGPRLSTFLFAIDRKTVLDLLSFGN